MGRDNNSELLCVLVCIASIAAAKSLQSCPTLCDPIDGSPPGSPVPGILQARTLEWVAISFPSAWKWKVKVKSISRVRLFTTPWTAAYQAPPSMGFSRQEYWSGVPSPSPIASSYRVVKMTNLKKRKKNLKNSLLECMIEHTCLTTLHIKQPKVRKNIWITEIGLLI